MQLDKIHHRQIVLEGERVRRIDEQADQQSGRDGRETRIAPQRPESGPRGCHGDVEQRQHGKQIALELGAAQNAHHHNMSAQE